MAGRKENGVTRGRTRATRSRRPAPPAGPASRSARAPIARTSAAAARRVGSSTSQVQECSPSAICSMNDAEGLRDPVRDRRAVTALEPRGPRGRHRPSSSRRSRPRDRDERRPADERTEALGRPRATRPERLPRRPDVPAGGRHTVASSAIARSPLRHEVEDVTNHRRAEAVRRGTGAPSRRRARAGTARGRRPSRRASRASAPARSTPTIGTPASARGSATRPVPTPISRHRPRPPSSAPSNATISREASSDRPRVRS